MAERVGMRGKPLRSDKMTAPKMSICQWEMKRRPVGISYRRPRQPVGKISSKSLSVASLIHKKEKIREKREKIFTVSRRL